MRLLAGLAILIVLPGCASLIHGMGLTPHGEGPKADDRQEAYVANHPDLDPDIRDAILAGSIRRGMTREQVEASWGTPCVLCRRDDERLGDRVETIVYGKRLYPKGHVYIHLEDGRVVGWSQ